MPLALFYLWVLLISFAGANHCAGRRIVAVGDLHGDLNQTLSILSLAGLVDKRQHWIGKDTYLVQLGDVLDVGPDDLMIVRLLMKLEKEAQAEGGNVIQLLGNHEIRNLLGDYKAVDPASLAHSGGKLGRAEMLSNRTALGMYLRTRKAIYHHKEFMFMHGGFSTATGNMINGIKAVHEFNAAMRDALVHNNKTPMGKTALNLNEKRAQEVANPILVRSIYYVRCPELKKILTKKFPGIKSVVVGHVPHNAQDFSDWRLCDGRLLAIDFGLSRWKKGDPGHVAALEIDDTTMHVQLMESTMNFLDYEPDVHSFMGLDVRRSLPFLRLAAVVVFIILILWLVGMWICSRERSKRLPAEPQVAYGSVAP
ncbi:serine/threonine protein phosphatase [Trypanosoma conorhini]|uniref:Serine/threonine protein phosphatase n=1 Tax=Trypanosoma conorhini TaxID=83891 RepID=A0A3S5IT07_9TRYP|nr:serine/threonine protein phosphatase [Trypanosoma conorhini]RNF16344.1 serine/threonine protein phosphatase [Trypanosoma conorhini]